MTTVYEKIVYQLTCLEGNCDDRCESTTHASARQTCGVGHTTPAAFFALLATAVISLAPMVVLPLLPSVESAAGKKVQPLLLCFAAGGMLGDVFLHILPHSLGHGDSHAYDHEHGHSHAHDHDDHHGHSHAHDHGDHDHSHAEGHGHSHSIGEALIGLSVLAGFLAFFLVEKLVRNQKAGGHSHGHSHGHPSGHSHDHTEGRAVSASCCDAEHEHDNTHSGHDHSHEHAHEHVHAPSASSPPSKRTRAAKSPRPVRPATPTAPHVDKKAVTKSVKKEVEKEAMPRAVVAAEPVSTGAGERLIAGYLNLAADAAHNFTDGLALGAAFQTSFALGVNTMVTVLVHEVPHEIGDVAILMQAGFPKWKAIRAQLATAIGAVLGVFVALAMGESKSVYLLNFTAGGFIYIATVDVLPGLLRDDCTALQTACELAAMCAGISMMIIVLWLESA